MSEEDRKIHRTGLVCLLVGMVLGVVLLTLASAVNDYKAYDNRYKPIVQSVCDYSREVNSGKWEEACRNVQEGSNTEYLCKNYQDGTFCWVEKK